MARAAFRLHGELLDLLPAARRGAPVLVDCAHGATVGHAVETLGVPHVEIGAIEVDGRPASANSPVRDGDVVDVRPVIRSANAPARFVADAHLGGLARRMRLLGFDCTLAREHSDADIAAVSDSEGRAVLSRDRGLLMHRRVARGRFVRATDVDGQVREVLDAFVLRERAAPFTRCLECNGVLRAATVDEAGGRIPPAVASQSPPLTLCTGCGRVYWPGSHWRRLRETVARMVA
jgi:uncharacterized protein with PIN domain